MFWFECDIDNQLRLMELEQLLIELILMSMVFLPDALSTMFGFEGLFVPG
jgi:hypothetical protein